MSDTKDAAAITRTLRSEKLVVVGKMSACVVHDLNNLLTSILVFAEALVQDLAKQPDAQESATEILTAARRSRELIQRFLRYARRPLQAPTSPVVLAPLLADVQLLLQQRVHLASLTLSIDAPAVTVWGRQAELEHLVVDLLFRAIEAGRAGDAIRLVARPVAGRVALDVVFAARAVEGALPADVPWGDLAAAREAATAMGATLTIEPHRARLLLRTSGDDD